jgi:hypothetical protein
MSCPVCHHPLTKVSKVQITGVDAAHIECINCGEFDVSGSALVLLPNFDGRRWMVSSWMRERQCTNVTTSTIGEWRDITPPSLETRALKALRWLGLNHSFGAYISKASFYSTLLGVANATWSSPLPTIAWCRDFRDFSYLISNVMNGELGWIDQVGSEDDYFQISPKGWLYLEGYGQDDSKVGFCAMWFSDEVRALWTDCIEPAILDAGYEPLRIDGKEHNNKIDDEIIASIRQSKFVISDLTGNRGGVYYEAGFAHGLGLPVIFMCRKSEEDNPHFDIRQYNTIFWTQDTIIEKRKELMNRIIATIGKGSYAPAIQLPGDQA